MYQIDYKSLIINVANSQMKPIDCEQVQISFDIILPFFADLL